MCTLQEAAKVLFESKCKHVDEYGLSAFTNFGPEAYGLEQCILCGEVRCTIPDIDGEDDLVPARYSL